MYIIYSILTIVSKGCYTPAIALGAVIMRIFHFIRATDDARQPRQLERKLAEN